MLYDNAQLARIYLWAGIELEEPRFVDVPGPRWVIRSVTSGIRTVGSSRPRTPTPKAEGKFYVWTTQELERGARADFRAEAARFFGATPHGNFEGSNILYRPTNEPWTERIESMRPDSTKHRLDAGQTGAR